MLGAAIPRNPILAVFPYFRTLPLPIPSCGDWRVGPLEVESAASALPKTTSKMADAFAHDFVEHLNAARRAPSDFAASLEAQLGSCYQKPTAKGCRLEVGGEPPIMTKEGRGALEECVQALRIAASVGALTECVGLSAAADDRFDDGMCPQIAPSRALASGEGTLPMLQTFRPLLASYCDAQMRNMLRLPQPCCHHWLARQGAWTRQRARAGEHSEEGRACGSILHDWRRYTRQVSFLHTTHTT